MPGYVLVYVHMYTDENKCVCVLVRGQLQAILLKAPSTLASFETKSLADLKLAKQARLAGQGTLGILLSLTPVLVFKHVPMHSALPCGL